MLFAAFVTSGQPNPAASHITLACPASQVGKYQKLEFSLQVSGTYTNPFDPDEVEVSVQLTREGGQTLTLPAFYCQPYERRRLGAAERQRDWLYPTGLPGWRARFAPMATGTYQAVAVLKDRHGTASSAPVRFTCGPSPAKGFVRVSRQDPRFLEFTEGQAFFPIGQNLAFIGDQQYVSLSRAEAIFGKLVTNGGNYLRLWTCCEDWAMAIEARKSAWGRSWEWHAPIVPMPGTENTNRKCLQLAGNDARLRVQPSHQLALRPGTRYVLSGKVRTQGEANLRLESSLIKADQARVTAPPETWTDFHAGFQTGPGDNWLPELAFRLQGQGTAWLSDLSLREAAGGPELLWEAEVNRAPRGFYNPLDAFLLDELVAAADQQGLYLQLCLLTRDLYMNALKEPGSPEYERAIQDACKLFRYAVGRWGYATSVAAWEYWNEMNPSLPTDRFYTALGQYLEQTDLYHHLRTTSTWGPSAKDCRHPSLDVADTHFYLRPSDRGRLEDEVDAVLERTRWLRTQAPNKPAHLGEFGLANEKWGPTDEMQRSPELVDVHNVLWASALSGASGTALFWWWERLDQREAYPLYRPLSRFLADVPWTGGKVQPAQATCSDPQVRTVGLQAGSEAWLWLFSRNAAWGEVVLASQTPPAIAQAKLQVKQLPPGTYLVRWWDTRQGTLLREDKVNLRESVLQLAVPEFTRDTACHLTAR